MSPVWDADNEVSAATAANLISSQFPGLVPVEIELIGVGWDNAAFLVNGRFVFRFPRRQMGADLLRHEMRILPLLAPALRFPIPLPEFEGHREGDYPYDFAGYLRIAGITACQVNWSDAARSENAVPLARFLSALHSIPITPEVAAWAPGDELRRADVAFRAPQLRERLDGLKNKMPEIDVAAIDSRIDQLAGTPLRTEPSCWVHGDLYARHLLVDSQEILCGVIDWGDVHCGDPGVDLSIVYSFLPPEARNRFWDVYGAVDEHTRGIARFRALHYGAILIAYGMDVNDTAIVRVGEDALRLGIL